jgi:hypothetical protein
MKHAKQMKGGHVLCQLNKSITTWQKFWTRDRSIGSTFTYTGEHKAEKCIYRPGVDPGMPVSDWPKKTGTFNRMSTVIGAFIILFEME